MTNKTITLGLAVAERLVSAIEHGALFRPDDLEALRAAIAEPVPPAGGEPEVPQRRSWSGIASWKQRAEVNAWNAACDEWAPHVTRLQAEVDRLKDRLADANATANLAVTNLKEFKEDRQSELASANADKAAYAQNAIDLRAQVDQKAEALDVAKGMLRGRVKQCTTLQSELTKARELLEEADNFMYIMTGHDSHARLIHRYGKEWWTPVNELRGKICTTLSNQSAPAGKGQDGPVHMCQKCKGLGSMPTRHAGEGETEYRNRCKLYAEQPAPVAVVKTCCGSCPGGCVIGVKP